MFLKFPIGILTLKYKAELTKVRQAKLRIGLNWVFRMHEQLLGNPLLIKPKQCCQLYNLKSPDLIH